MEISIAWLFSIQNLKSTNLFERNVDNNNYKLGLCHSHYQNTQMVGLSSEWKQIFLILQYSVVEIKNKQTHRELACRFSVPDIVLQGI